MWVEPEFNPENVFGLAMIDPEEGFMGLTPEAKQKLKDCHKIYFIMATGVTGRGKSTKLSQLINPDFSKPKDGDIEYIFRAAGGPDPVTGHARDNMNFPAFGPIKLSTFCNKWKIPTEEDDDLIGLVFVDSQGTKAITENGRGLASATSALTTALGLRICVTNPGRPSSQDYGAVGGGISLNIVVTKGDERSAGYSIAVLNPDVYNKEESSEHEAERNNKNEKYTQIWRDNNPVLQNAKDFKLFLLDNPFVNNEGYWKSMLDVAKWIAQLARRDNRNFITVQGCIDIATEVLQQFRRENPDYTDDADIDVNELVERLIASQIDTIFKDVDDVIDNIAKEKVNNIPDQNIMTFNTNSIAQEAIKVGTEKFNSILNSYYSHFRDNFPDCASRYDEKISDDAYQMVGFYYSDRRQHVIDNVIKKLNEHQMNVIKSAVAEAEKDINGRKDEDILVPNFVESIKEQWVSKSEIQFRGKLDNICLSPEIQNEESVKDSINDLINDLQLNMKLSIQSLYQKRATQANNNRLHKLEEDAKREQQRLEQLRQQDLSKMEENHRKQVQQLLNQAAEDKKKFEAQSSDLKTQIQSLIAKQSEITNEMQKRDALFKEQQARREEDSKRTIETMLRQFQEEKAAREKNFQNQMNELRRQKEMDTKTFIENWKKTHPPPPPPPQPMPVPIRHITPPPPPQQPQRPSPPPPQQPQRPHPGMRVRVRRGALVYGKNYPYHNWVYDAVFDLRELRGDRAVIYRNGGCTGPVHINDLYPA